jgi:trehalose 6-phosphate synthase
MSLVLVSNRVARFRPDQPVEGGLAAALIPAVQSSGAVWVGASGRLADSVGKEPPVEIETLGAGAIATVDFPKAHYRGFYEGYANSALWPVLHSRIDLIRTTSEEYRSYREINACMARALQRFAKPRALVWVHDYHFFTLGAELRRLGLDLPLGFFLHTPFPARHVLKSLPNHGEIVRAMLAYDLIGVQTEEDQQNLADYLRYELGLRGNGETFATERATVRLASFPVGIDAEKFAARATKAAAGPEVSRLRSSLQHAKLAIGVDRVDYSKGLANRMQALDRLLQTQPSLKRAVSLLQIAVPSRGQIPAYRQLQTDLAAMVSDINGRHGEVDWLPIRYLNKAYSQAKLAGFYRTARVGLVTSLHDGMNLVAKEYVAAQNPLDPGVLVLSQFAGAAKQLDAAVLVNPHDIDGMASAISTALTMPLDERRRRWDAMMTGLKTDSLEAWFDGFARALSACREPPLAPDRDLALPLPLRVDGPPQQPSLATSTAGVH